MDTLKKLAGVLTFLAVFSLSIAVTKYFYTPFKTATKVSRVAPSSPQIFTPQANARLASYQVKLVSLDFQTRQSYTTLTLNRDLDQPAPERLWVRTYFFTPDRERDTWSTDTVELRRPFENGNTVTLTATASCRRCDNALAPDAGYYARVQISTRSGNDVLLRNELIDDDFTTATPVLVQNERDRSSSSKASR